MRKALLFMTLGALLAAPIGSAAWGARGNYEPDTARDVQDGWIFTGPPTQDGQVYFSGFQGQNLVAIPRVNSVFTPGSSHVQSAVLTYPFVPWALLGVWKDCNADGYIGYGDQGLWDYRIELLQDPLTGALTGPCPIEAVPDPIPANWAPVHNDGDWIREFIPIGWDTWRTSVAADGTVSVRETVDLNPWDFNDSEARVWGEWNLPESGNSQSCYVNPHPRGTYQHTGLFLEWSDCFTGNKIHTVGDTAAGQTGQQQLWADVRDIDNPWGNESQSAMVDAFDCESGNVFQPQDPTYDPSTGKTAGRGYVDDPTGQGLFGEDGRFYYNLTPQDGFILYGANVSAPKVGAPNLGGSPGGTVNETETDLDDCDRSDNTWGDAWVDGEGSDGNLPYILEGDVANTNGLKFQSDHVLFYADGRMEDTCHYQSGVCVVDTAPVREQTGESTPRGYGVKILGLEGCLTSSPFSTTDANCNDGFWGGDTATVASRNPYFSRNDAQPMKVSYITYYAKLGDSAISTYGFKLPAGAATGKYGAEHCGTTPTGQWDCNAANWWPKDIIKRDGRLGPDPATTSAEPKDWLSMPVVMRVGEAFHLRDIDCFDQSAEPLRSNNVHFGTVTDTKCE